MELITKIKASGINNLSDARYFSPFAEWIGFNFSPDSSNYVPLDKAKELIGWLSGPRIIAEFEEQDETYINQVCEILQIDSIQTDVDLNFTALSPVVSTVIRRIAVSEHMDDSRLESILVAHSGSIAYFVLDFTASKLTWQDLQSHPYFSISRLQEWCENFPIILQLSFSPETVLEVVKQIKPLALNLIGGTEDKIGLRAFDDLDPIVEQLEVEDW